MSNDSITFCFEEYFGGRSASRWSLLPFCSLYCHYCTQSCLVWRFFSLLLKAGHRNPFPFSIEVHRWLVYTSQWTHCIVAPVWLMDVSAHLAFSVDPWIVFKRVIFHKCICLCPSPLQYSFFERAKYEEKVPSYNAVRIRREERAINAGNSNWNNLEKKPWMTTWHDNKHYS